MEKNQKVTYIPKVMTTSHNYDVVNQQPTKPQMKKEHEIVPKTVETKRASEHGSQPEKRQSYTVVAIKSAKELSQPKSH